MGNSAIANGLTKLIKKSAKLLGELQVGVNKILWGVNNQVPTIQGAKFTIKDRKVNYSFKEAAPATPPKEGVGLVESGLFNALDALNEVDLCNVIAYVTDTINLKKKPRPEKPWTAAQTALYTLQDEAALVQSYIDKFTAYPNVFIGSYLGTGPNAVPIDQAVSQSGAPTGGGTKVVAYNVYFLMQSIKDTFSFSGPDSIFSAEDKTLLTTVPGLGSNLNIVDDFIGTVNKYSDYRNIPNDELQTLINKINIIRSVCVTIQNLDFKSGLALIGNFLNTDIRAQIQKISDFLNPTKIIPTLKEINASIRSFIKIAQQVQGIISTGQFIIKIALLFYKVFKFIFKFFGALMTPLAWSTAGLQTVVQDAKNAAKSEIDGVSRVLKGVNALLSVALIFIRYLTTNANELLRRLDTLLIQLEGCEAVKNSDVILELQKTREALVTLRDQLETYITQYDSKTDPDTAMFGGYDIRVVDEEVTDKSITNKRRRGIALDQNGQIVVQSDLTFATNTSVIIAEVKQQLVAQKFVQPSLGVINGTDLATISESLDYLDSNDILNDNLTITPTELDSPDNLDASQGLGINAFINNLKGGKELRQRSRAAVLKSAKNVKAQVAKEMELSAKTLNINQQQNK